MVTNNRHISYHLKGIDKFENKMSRRNNIIENKIRIYDDDLSSQIHEILFNDIRIFFVKHIFSTGKKFFSTSEYPNIQMHFVLDGLNYACSKRTGKIYKVENNQHNMFYVPHSDIEYKVAGNQTQIFGIQFTANYFYRFADEGSKVINNFIKNIVKNEESILVSKQNLLIVPSIKLLISTIFNFQRQKYFRKLFLESKVIELLMMQLEQAETDFNKSLTISKKDRDKLFAVKELIEQNLLYEYTLKELSFEVGLNEFKLKKGFKEVFGKTVFNYFNDLRMEYAKNLIIEGAKNISEVADILGYSAPQHFTYAFKKKFGVLPRTLK